MTQAPAVRYDLTMLVRAATTRFKIRRGARGLAADQLDRATMCGADVTSVLPRDGDCVTAAT